MSEPRKKQDDLAELLEEKCERIRLLEQEIKKLSKQTLDARVIRREIFKLSDAKPVLPTWVKNLPKSKISGPGIPVAVASDWHWGERINPDEIGGVNKFNIEIAHERAKTFFYTIITLLKDHMVNPSYKGLVLCLGGDMLSGNIHQELTDTNEIQVLPAILDIYKVLITGINLLQKEFGNILIPCVTGNHARNTIKTQAKERNHTSYDWLLYQMLEQYYANNPHVTFMISNGVDQLFKVYNHRFLLTHGDTLGKGGDGIIGCIGPIIRGDHKTRSRNGQIGQDYDTMICGHYHQLMWVTPKVVANGCFPAGSLVTTDNGYKPIEEVSEGDLVLSHDGTWNPVTHLFSRTSDDGLVHLKVRGIDLPITCTPNHEIYAIKGESKKCDAIGVKWDTLIGNGDKPQWIPADFISPGDYVAIPSVPGKEEPITEDLAWAYGLYIAEGCTILRGGARKSINSIRLTMHDRELGVLQKFAVIMAQYHPEMSSSRVYTRIKSTGARTSEYVCNPGLNLVEWFRDQFGHLAVGKHLPDWMMHMAPNLKRALLQGWVDGDGHTSKRDNKTSCTTISYTLAHQMFDQAISCGLVPSLGVLAAGGPRKHTSYTICFREGQETRLVDGTVFYRVNARYRDLQIVPVYDLTVEGPHSYTIHHCGVHNSLCGYNEFAGNMLRASFEVPQQALFCVHPEHGITYQMPILVEPKKLYEIPEWTSWPTLK